MSILGMDVKDRQGLDVARWRCGVHPVVDGVFSDFGPDEAVVDWYV